MPAGWQIGGVLGVIALLLFMAVSITSAVLGPIKAGPTASAQADPTEAGRVTLGLAKPASTASASDSPETGAPARRAPSEGPSA
jgi:hypothetical protein